MKKLAIWLLLLLLGAQNMLWAQQDSVITQPAQATQNDTQKVDKDTLNVSKVWALSLILPSFGQIYNKQYWKVPIVLGGIGGMLYGAYKIDAHSTGIKLHNYDLTNRNLLFLGGFAIYYWSLLDDVKYYHYNKDAPARVSPARAGIYSTMLPGLGQIYNQKYWKLPLVYGGFLAFGYLIQSRNFRYKLFRDIYNNRTNNAAFELEISKLDPVTDASKITEIENNMNKGNLDFKETWGIQSTEIMVNSSLENIQYYKTSYRRDRDYYIILMSLFYGLNVIDAIVDAHLSTYDISNDLSFQITPFVERHQYANSNNTLTGLSLNFKF
jgi:hypothetical protein